MRIQNTVTFIVSRNYGHPLSWSMQTWKVFLIGVLGGGILVVMVALSIAFLVTYPQLKKLELERDLLQKERKQLSDQLLSANQEAFEGKEKLWLQAMARGAGRRLVENERGDNLEALDYVPPVRILSVKTTVNRTKVEVAFRMTRPKDGAKNRGGYLFVIFENEEEDPSRFVPSPKVATNSEGFPQSYKSGVRYLRINDAVTFRRRIKRGSKEEYFTHVSLFLFSLRGGLVIKDRYELDRDLFRGDDPPVRTQILHNT